ncbi:hypothetical protein FOA52_008427 [Chlamydomonas sp. UWO 241]|nr:hypothetical protein FOA52_008427 [Chlamydomonas sp. UWO 241]
MPEIIGLEGGFACAILAVALVLMAGDWVRPDLNFLTTMAVYTASRMITVAEAAAGFGNVGLLSVMALFSVAAGIARTGGMARVIRFTTGRATEHVVVLIRMLLPVLVASAFLNNTPIVAVLIPIVMSWARRNSQSPKAILICLSYTAILGGTCTLIGTSTNLVIVGFQAKEFPDDPSFTNPGIFDISPYGLAYAAWGFIFLMLFSEPLLKSKTVPMQTSEDLLVGLLVPKGSRHAGESVASAGLRHLKGVFLVSIKRGQGTLHAVGPETILQEHDVLSFAGDLTKVQAVSTQFGLPVFNSESDNAWEAEQGLPPTCTSVVPHSPTWAPWRGRDRGDEGSLATRSAGGTLPRLSSPTRVDLKPPSSPTHVQDLPLQMSRDLRTAARSGSLDSVRRTASPSQGGALQSSLSIKAAETMHEAGPGRFLRCTVKASSSLVGLTIKQAGFRSRFGAAVVTVSRPASAASPPPPPAHNALVGMVLGKGSKGGKGAQPPPPPPQPTPNALVGITLGGRRAKVGKGAAPLPTHTALVDVVLQAGHELLLDVGPDFDEGAPAMLENFDSVQRDSADQGKEYMTAFSVRKVLSGKTIKEVGFVGISGVSLVHLDAVGGGTIMQPVPPDTELNEGDVLWFAGDVEGLTFLFATAGLDHFESDQVEKAGVDDLERRLMQVVVATGSPLIGRSVRESHFRSKYNAAIVAVHRRGNRLKQKIGDIELVAGDVLLLDAGNAFLEQNADSNAFALISEVPQSAPQNSSRIWLALFLFCAMITIMIVQSFLGETWISLWTAALLTTSLMVLTRCLTWDQAKASFDWTVYLTIASAFGVSQAISNTGVADNIAWLLIQPSIAIGGTAPFLSSMYIITALLSEILTNNAAAALMYPIASIAGNALGVDPKLTGYSLMLGASSSFISPFGYQTNLMVFNAGGMRFWDLAKIGVPLQVWMWVGATIILGLHESIVVVMFISLAISVGVGLFLLALLYLPCMAPFKAKIKGLQLLRV